MWKLCKSLHLTGVKTLIKMCKTCVHFCVKNVNNPPLSHIKLRFLTFSTFSTPFSHIASTAFPTQSSTRLSTRKKKGKSDNLLCHCVAYCGAC